MTPPQFEDNQLLAAKTRTSAIGHVLLLLITVSGTWRRENAVVTPIFALAILGFTAGRVLMGRPRAHADPRPLRRWLIGYASFTIATALSWGLLCARTLLMNGLGDLASILLLFVCAGICAAGSNSLSANRRLASWFTCAIIAPVALALAFRDFAGFWPFVGMLITYQGFLVFQIGASNVMIRILRERESQYKTLVDATHESILVHRNGLILEVNAAFERTFDYPPSASLGKDVFDLIHSDDVAKLRAAALLDDGQRRVARVRHRDGRYRAVEIRGRNLIYAGEAARVSCVNDISTQVEAEESLRLGAEQRRRLSDEREAAALEALRLKSEFLANVGHEMRTPLNGIIGLTDLLAEAPAGETREYYLGRLRASGESLLRLINDLLDFTELDAGRIEFEDAPFALPSLVEQQVELARASALAKNLTIGVSFDANVPAQVRGDAARLGQVVLHLLNNAIKFTEAGGVTVRCTCPVRDAGTARIRVDVVDTGVGISADLVDRLFNPFTKGDASTSRKHGGTGLGLSICKRLVDGLGGKIAFAATEAGGACFWFELPLAISDTEPALVRPTPVNLKDLKFAPVDILVVEDNSTNQMLILAVLAGLGLRARAVVNGAECLRALDESTYALILMDCQMPEMDGFEATRRIRAREARDGGHIPIVALTANVMQEDRERCFASGMDAFVAKPVKREKLVAELSRFLDVQKRGRDEKAS